ncbi:MAG: hypothetical protein WEE03_10190 [Chloroflexota bacterium]
MSRAFGHRVTRPAFMAAAIFLITLATRVPFVSRELWAWDSVLYARALEDGFHVDYLVAGQRPHPPGYLLYVATSAAVRLLTGDSNDALVLVSIVASAFASAALFLFARRFASDRSAAIVAFGFGLSPLVWQYSEVAYPYTLLGLLSILVAASFAYTRGRGAMAALVASAVFGAVAGFRMDLLLIFAPLWLCLVGRRRRRGRAAAAVSVSLGCLAWLVPTAALSGGILSYLDALFRQTDFVRATYSVMAQGLVAFGTNVATTLYAIGWGLGLFTLPVVVLAVANGLRAIRARGVRLDEHAAVLLAWIVPALALYIVLHIGEWGYVLSILPGLYVVAAVAIDRAAAVHTGARRLALAAGVLVPAFVFVTSSAPFSAAAIARHDWELASRVAYVRQHYPAQSTLLLAREDYLLVRYYLPEYRTWFHDPEPYRSTLRRKRAPRVNAIVVFTPGLQTTSADALRIRCAKDVELVYLAIEPGSVVELQNDRYTIAESPARR